MTETLSGGCFCGAVRYAVDGPEQFACYCHCHSCQHAAGAPVLRAHIWTEDKPDWFEIGDDLPVYEKRIG